jgi:hypothetical protein
MIEARCEPWRASPDVLADTYEHPALLALTLAQPAHLQFEHLHSVLPGPHWVQPVLHLHWRSVSGRQGRSVGLKELTSSCWRRTLLGNCLEIRVKSNSRQQWSSKTGDVTSGWIKRCMGTRLIDAFVLCSPLPGRIRTATSLDMRVDDASQWATMTSCALGFHYLILSATPFSNG